ncbi:hypothetical protein EPUS_05770 [Endocarpon pusillum Z07020]|uniref:E3 ubiquitin-protein ligase CCNB1IP1 n=1 Tax=Endocarpon pusillum (strain Z07020 / HMAS-L-300199) TaxID=1263415 RepID=U1HIJ8_ENDPU|nr:uncharacterized protein EPUS_05770 [Endocarpon pusillum Z07020]ERF68709.1 hypothetical protein EPUS_05770 [Endocarpon pusillum Z07020]
MGKNLADKYSHLSSQLDKIVADANAEIQSLQSKVKSLQIDQKTLQQKNVELVEMYRDKSKKQAQTQHLYDTLKKRVMTSQVQTAASDSVAQAINSMSSIPRPQTFGDASVQQPPPPNYRTNDQRGNMQYEHAHHSRSPSRSSKNAHAEAEASAMPPPSGPPMGQQSHGFASATPQHRTHLPGTVRNAATRSYIPLSTKAPDTVPRKPLTNLTNSRNSQSGSSGYGITAGMKVGRPSRSALNNNEQISDRFNGIAHRDTKDWAVLTKT